MHKSSLAPTCLRKMPTTSFAVQKLRPRAFARMWLLQLPAEASDALTGPPVDALKAAHLPGSCPTASLGECSSRIMTRAGLELPEPE